jgi:8-oxo-dGTP pyrophosphatase MutT (NUDIX family)
MDRSKLPFRRNCEGYFITKDKKILAQNTGKKYLVFPGGGIDKGEHADSAVVRETLEETGAIIKLPIKDLGVVQFLWDEEWIRTEKQKKRFKKYKGEEMHFFFGTIKEFKENHKQYEDYWEGEKLMPISKAIKIIKKEKPFPENMKIYREAQLKFLNKIVEKKD